jgi:hypothetical protein
MMHSIFRNTNFFLILILLSGCSGQPKEIGKETREMISRIDSRCISIDEDKNLIEGISEGEYKENNQIIGGFDIYTLKNKENDTLYRIRSIKSRKGETTGQTFYYSKKRLIKGICWITNSSFLKGNERISKFYYYKNDTLIYSGTGNEECFSADEMLKYGKSFLKDFETRHIN